MFGSWGVQASDPNLADKLAALKGARKSPTDAVRDFIRTDIGVDPDTLPMTEADAADYLNGIRYAEDYLQIDLIGNSLGFRHAYYHGYDETFGPFEVGDPKLGRCDDAWKAIIIGCPEYTSFKITNTGITFLSQKKPRWKTVTKYPSGTVLRIAKRSCPTIMMYIRIGGLLDETTPTDLDTMQPVDTRDWYVTEEL